MHLDCLGMISDGLLFLDYRIAFVAKESKINIFNLLPD